jgi:putative spermidine/putrescine transport system ATP-binding protein
MGDVELTGAAGSCTSGDEILVTFKGVTKTYDGRTLAVSGLDLQIGRGEFVTFLGPSGSGKTTSLMMLAGFEEPTGGDILLGRRSVRHIPPHKRNIGMVFQNYALFPHMSVAENIAFPLSVRGVARAESDLKVAHALELVRLKGLGHRRPAQLSGGQQQRVALARAIVFGPDLVLMDEPLGALDKQLREQLQLEIKHLHANLGVTIVYVTHDQSEALTLSDRIVVFNEGAAQQVDTPTEIYEHPTSSFVAQFIGENNRLDGHVTAFDGKYCRVRTSAGDIRALAVRTGGVGSTTSLSIRPERILLGAPGTLAAENTVDARVLERIYHGDHHRIRLALDGAGEFILRVPSTTELAEDGIVQIGWAAEHCRALDAFGATRADDTGISQQGAAA